MYFNREHQRGTNKPGHKKHVAIDSFKNIVLKRRDYCQPL